MRRSRRRAAAGRAPPDGRRLALPANDNQLVGRRLRAPDLARTAVELANGATRIWQRQAAEGLRRRGEADECVDAEVAQPDGAAVVHVDGVRLRLAAREAPLAPDLRRRRVAGDVAGEPLADPEVAAGIAPDASRALVGSRRLDDLRPKAGAAGDDPSEVAAGERGEVDSVIRRHGDPVGTGAAGRGDGRHAVVTGARIEATEDAGLPGEPKDAVAIEDRRVEIGVVPRHG